MYLSVSLYLSFDFVTCAVDKCCDQQDATISPIAVLLHHSTFDAILAWGAIPPSSPQPTPFSHVYAHLAMLGYPVRLAAEPLVVDSAALPLLDGNHSNFCATAEQVRRH